LSTDELAFENSSEKPEAVPVWAGLYDELNEKKAARAIEQVDRLKKPQEHSLEVHFPKAGD
jgi:hypothetical protein